MQYRITHEATIKADSESEAERIYLDNWYSAQYDSLDLTIEEVEEDI